MYVYVTSEHKKHNYKPFEYKEERLVSLSGVFLMHLYTCKIPFRNLVARLHWREVVILQEKSTSQNDY